MVEMVSFGGVLWCFIYYIMVFHRGSFFLIHLYRLVGTPTVVEIGMDRKPSPYSSVSMYFIYLYYASGWPNYQFMTHFQSFVSKLSIINRSNPNGSKITTFFQKIFFQAYSTGSKLHGDTVLIIFFYFAERITLALDQRTHADFP